MPLRSNIFSTSFVYEALVSKLEQSCKLDPAETIERVEELANFAYVHHPGVFADGRIENLLLDLKEEVAKVDSPDLTENFFPAGGHPRVLHVASEVYETGGHSRVLAKWIDKDLDSLHCVVLTRQHGDIPTLLIEACFKRGAKVVTLPISECKLGRAAALRNIARQADRVILHHHPDDAIPVLAFAAKGGAPVVFFNHAHFWFSLGGTVADITLNTLPYFIRLTEQFRFPRAVALLSAVPGNRDYVQFDKVQAKIDLGFDPTIPVILSIGSEHYFRPKHGCDFFATLRKILTCCGPLQVVLIGPSSQADFVPEDILGNKNVKLLGTVADPIVCYHAADICLESFPHPSLGGFVEAVLYGAAFPIPAYAERENILQIDMPPVSEVSPRPKNEEQYVKIISAKLQNMEETRAMATELQKRLWEVESNWQCNLRDVYSKVDHLAHAPDLIPAASCSFGQDHQLMASLKPFRLQSEIHGRFAYWQAIRLIVKAVFLRLISANDAFGQEWDYVKTRFTGRLR